MQRHQRFLKFGKIASPARTDHGPHQFGRGAGQRRRGTASPSCPALAIDQSVSRFVPTFAYEFNDENAPENFLPPVSFPYGAAHASEIQYLMDLPTAAFPGTLSAQQQQLAAIMKGYWTNFAKRGFPSSVGTPFWPLFSNLTQKMQSLAPATPDTETDVATTHNCAFWTALEG